MVLKAFGENELNFRQVEISLNDISARLRKYNYPEEYIYTAEYLFDLTLRDQSSNFSKELRENETYRDEICKFLSHYPIPQKNYKVVLEKFLRKSENLRSQSGYSGPLFNIGQAATNDAVKKEDFYKERREQEPAIYGVSVAEAPSVIQDTSSKLYRYVYDDENAARTISDHIEILKLVVLPEIARDTDQYYYVATPKLSSGIKIKIKRLFEESGLGTMNSAGRGFQIEFNTAKSPQDLLGGGVRQIKDLLRTPETFRILNDIRRSFFYAKEYPKSRGAEIYDPRLKTPESSAKKLADYQKRHPGKLMYWGDLPDIVGAIIAVPRLIDLENIMNYIRYRCLNLLLEEDNLFLKNPDKIYRDVKEDMKMATSATMNWELQLHLIECLPFNFLEHILYKKQEILPAVEVEAMKQIIWGPLAQILLEKLDEYETINKEYIAWIKKHKVDF